ncbi:MAG: SPASM domain-containing protein [Chloroflexia bacterium]|nr:SPASM domain-containing protein [Chloroflexia bacterium]
MPCSSYDQAVGNLIESDFSEVWEGKDAKYFREKRFAHELCSSCDSLAACNGACPLYWRSLGYRELEEIFDGKIVIK